LYAYNKASLSLPPGYQYKIMKNLFSQGKKKAKKNFIFQAFFGAQIDEKKKIFKKKNYDLMFWVSLLAASRVLPYCT